MSNAAYRPSDDEFPLTGSSNAQRNIGLVSGSVLAAFVAFIFGTCLFVSLDAMHKRYPAESPIIVSSLAGAAVDPRASDAF
jgi:hypothetical protein